MVIMHIKLKIFERAFQRRIIREIPTSNEGVMTVSKSVNAEKRARAPWRPRLGAVAPNADPKVETPRFGL